MNDGTGQALTATARNTPVGPVLEFAGELELGNTPVLRVALHRALTTTPAPPVLVVDLAGVTFCDCTGVNILLQARIDAERRGTALHLARPTRIVARILEVTGTDQVIPVDRGDPAAALSIPAG